MMSSRPVYEAPRLSYEAAPEPHVFWAVVFYVAAATVAVVAVVAGVTIGAWNSIGGW